MVCLIFGWFVGSFWMVWLVCGSFVGRLWVVWVVFGWFKRFVWVVWSFTPNPQYLNTDYYSFIHLSAGILDRSQ